MPTLKERLLQVDDEIWKMEVGPIKGGTSCNIEVVVADGVLTLNNVLFGDVWLCGGQSNMVFGMNGVYNATQEKEDAKRYTNIRFTRVNRESAEMPDDNMDILSLIHI